MPTPVLMPQMGESIAEGTIVRWIKKVGETVDRDEPLFELGQFHCSPFIRSSRTPSLGPSCRAIPSARKRR